MIVKDGKKVAAQGYIRADISSSITNINAMKGRIQAVMSGAVNVLDEDSAGEILIDCNAAIEALKRAEKMLTECYSDCAELNTDKWVDDEQY
jgi:hypothetical protein